MRVRVALTLFLALVVGILAAPAGAQEPPGGTTSDALLVARPRAAVLTLFQSGAEAFVHLDASDEASPIRLAPPSGAVPFVAPYEAFVTPLTAGYADFELHVLSLSDAGREELASDDAHVVAFGPFKRAGRLSAPVALSPGLHHLGVVVSVRARAVGVADWTTDTEDADLWVYVPQTNADGGLGPLEDAAAVGGLSVGGQRGAATQLAVGAVNFEVGHDADVLARVGQQVRVWSDYELWWAQGAVGDGRAALVVRPRPIVAGAAPLGRDVVEPTASGEATLVDGTLAVVLSFAEPGVYSVEAVLSTRIRSGDMVATDEDVVPFTVRVVGDPPPTGSVMGHVLDQDGLPLEGVLVEATGANAVDSGKARSGPDGAYLIEGLAPGEVLVHALPEDLNYLGEWWKESPTRAGAWPVKVEAGRTAEGIDFTLTPGATIAGHVTNARGAPLAGIEITIGAFARASDPAAPQPVPSDGIVGRARTTADGFYAVDQLPAGRYWVRATDPEGRVLGEYYDDAQTMAEADPVDLKAGIPVDGIDFVLAAGGALAGHVWAVPSAVGVRTPLGQIVVEARDPQAPDHVFGRAVTNADGRYRIGSLPPGTYLVRASDPAGHFSVEWYKEAAEVADAMPVEVPGGQVVDGIDFTLAPTQPVARLFVRPPVLGLTAGDDGDVAIAVANVANLAAFEVSLRWDPAVFTVDGVDPGEFLGSTGRQVIAVAPQIDNDQGTLHYGAASVGDAPGPNGEGVLFVIHLTAADHPGDSLLELTSSVLTDPAAVAIPHARDNGHVYVGRCMRGDFDCNCVIDIRDVMAVVLHWGTVHGDADYDALYDLDGDGDVDIVDVQIEASLWGQHCPTAPVADGASNDTSRASNDTSRAADGPVTDASTTVASTTDPIVRLTGPAGSVRSGAVSGMRPQGATLALAMVAGAPPTVGQELTVAVRVQDAVDLAGFDLALAYDPAALELKGAVLGDMLRASDRTFVRLGPTAVGGAVEVGAYSFPGAAAPQGAGDLVLLTFAVRAGGPSTLHVARATTVDSIGGSMPASAPDLDVAAVGVGNRYDLFVPYATGHD